jgi:hypothetical protein
MLFWQLGPHSPQQIKEKENTWSMHGSHFQKKPRVCIHASQWHVLSIIKLCVTLCCPWGQEMLWQFLS